jgi:hypothetical protein
MSQEINDHKDFSVKVENEIFYCSFTHDIVIDVKIAERVMEERKLITKGNALPTLIDFREVKYFLQGAKNILFTEGGIFEANAVAFIVNSFIIQTSIKFAMSQSAIPLSYHICASTKKGEEWLKKQSN